MRVKLIYRNYKPIHDLYASFKNHPPKDVEFIIPRQYRYLRYLLPVHRRFGYLTWIKNFTERIQQMLFYKEEDEYVDLYHFAQMVTTNIPNLPYVVDFEHIVSLSDYSPITSKARNRILNFLTNPLCHKIIPLSYAAYRSMRILFVEEFISDILQKTEIVYPALPNYQNQYSNNLDYSLVNPDPEIFKLLFVGNLAYLKGLHELVIAFEKLARIYQDIELYIISRVPRELKRKINSDRIKIYGPSFSHKDIVEKFYLPCDLFILPTHGDTFGMVLLFSLSCGTPVLTTKQFASPEIISSGHNGLFLHSNRLYLEEVKLPNRRITNKFNKANSGEEELINDLIDKIQYLYLNRDTLNAMSINAIEDFTPGGKFSINVRNRKLREIYFSCLSR